MIARVAIPLLLLPLLALMLPLMFALAWVQEAVSERATGEQPSAQSPGCCEEPIVARIVDQWSKDERIVSELTQ